MESKADWLRSEIEKFEGMRIKKVNHTGELWFNKCLTSIITRYKEELLELEKGV